MLQSFDLALEDIFEKVASKIPQRFNERLENILDLDERSSREFTLQPVKEEKVRGCDIQAVERMCHSIQSEVCHLFCK
jgi:hypothetical protein